MKKILFLLLMVLISFQLRSMESGNCMVCRNADNLMNIAGHGCHTHLCSFCYCGNLENPVFKGADGRYYWNYQCSDCGETIRFYSTVEMEEHVPRAVITHPSASEGS